MSWKKKEKKEKKIILERKDKSKIICRRDVKI